jgi:hypothetical protein
MDIVDTTANPIANPMAAVGLRDATTGGAALAGLASAGDAAVSARAVRTSCVRAGCWRRATFACLRSP